MKSNNEPKDLASKYSLKGCPRDLMISCGFTEEQANNMIKVRRILPVSEDVSIPVINARKLWELIGKPHKRFRDWADFHIKKRIDAGGLSAEISALTTHKSGSPQIDYNLSRNIASSLAMMANTPEGENVRRYFIDMETLALRLAEGFHLRVTELAKRDDQVKHHAHKQVALKAKGTKPSKAAIQKEALETYKEFQRIVCQVVTGYQPSEWRAACKNKGIRDILDMRDLSIYADAHLVAVTLFMAGNELAEVRHVLQMSFANKIDATNYPVSFQLEDDLQDAA